MTDPSTRSLRHMALPDPGTRRGISRFTKPQNVCTGHYATYTNGFLRSPSGPRSCSMKGSALSDGFAHDRSEEHTSELQSRLHLVCRLLLEKKKKRWLGLRMRRPQTRSWRMCAAPARPLRDPGSAV